jgi:plastocyanin
LAIGLIIIATLIRASAAQAEEHIVATRGNQWLPAIVFIDVGDSIVWTGMTTHETELVDGLHPEGAQLWRSELNEEGFSATFDEPGAYIYKCHVHLGAGMFGAVVVGPVVPENLAAIDAAESVLDTERVFVQRVVARMKREINRRERAGR